MASAAAEKNTARVGKSAVSDEVVRRLAQPGATFADATMESGRVLAFALASSVGLAAVGLGFVLLNAAFGNPWGALPDLLGIGLAFLYVRGGSPRTLWLLPESDPALAPADPAVRGAEFLLVLPAAPDTPAPSSMP